MQISEEFPYFISFFCSPLLLKPVSRRYHGYSQKPWKWAKGAVSKNYMLQSANTQTQIHTMRSLQLQIHICECAYLFGVRFFNHSKERSLSKHSSPYRGTIKTKERIPKKILLSCYALQRKKILRNPNILLKHLDKRRKLKAVFTLCSFYWEAMKSLDK